MPTKPHKLPRMVQAAASPQTKTGPAVSRDEYLAAYRWMLLARLSEEKYAGLYRAGKIFGGVFVSRGQEALSASIGVSLRRGVDIFSPLIRDQAARLAFGESLLDATRTVLGSKLGPMRGRDGNVHRGRPREGYFAMISHLGAMISRGGGIAGPPVQGDHRLRGRDMHRRRRHLDRRLSRGRQPGGGGKTAAGGCRCQQPIRLLHAERTAVCLRRPRGQGRRLRHRTATPWMAPISPPVCASSATP